MATVASGTSTSFAVGASTFITLTTSGATEGSITFVPEGAGTQSNAAGALSFGPPALAGKQYGPWGSSGTVTITSKTGAIDWSTGGVRGHAAEHAVMGLATSASPAGGNLDAITSAGDLALNRLPGRGIVHGKVLRGFSDYSDITVANDTNIASTLSWDSSSSNPFGHPSLKINIVSTSGVNAGVLLTSPASDIAIPNFLSGNRRLVVHAVVDQPYASLLQFDMWAGINGFSRQMYGYFGPQGISKTQNRLLYGLHNGNKTTSGLLSGDTVTAWKLKVWVKPGQTLNIWIDSLYLPEITPPFCCITFDDGAATAYDAHQALRSRGLHGSFGIIGGQLGVASYLTLAQAIEMAGAGHDMSSHNQTNTPYAGTVAYIQEFRQSRQVLEANGIHTAPFYHPYVQGYNDDALHQALKTEGVRICRAIDVGLTEPFLRGQNDNLFGLSQYQLGSGLPLATAKAHIDNALTYGQDICFMGHTLGTPATYTYDPADFGALLDYAVAKLGAQNVGSISEWAKYRGWSV